MEINSTAVISGVLAIIIGNIIWEKVVKPNI